MCIYCVKGPPDSLDLVSYLEQGKADNETKATRELFDRYWSASCAKSQETDGWKLNKWGMYWTDHSTVGE